MQLLRAHVVAALAALFAAALVGAAPAGVDIGENKNLHSVRGPSFNARYEAYVPTEASGYVPPAPGCSPSASDKEAFVLIPANQWKPSLCGKTLGIKYGPGRGGVESGVVVVGPSRDGKVVGSAGLFEASLKIPKGALVTLFYPS